MTQFSKMSGCVAVVATTTVFIDNNLIAAAIGMETTEPAEAADMESVEVSEVAAGADFMERWLSDSQSSRPTVVLTGGGEYEVEEKFGEQNFRVLSEMRILAEIKVVILNLVG